MKFLVVALLAALASAVNAQEVISLHGSGTTNPSKCYWHIMDLIQTQTKLPVRMTYRGVGSSTGQKEFTGDNTTSDNHFGSGDIPFSTEDYSVFEANSILHLPIVMGAISFFHSAPTGGEKLNLSPCVLAKIFKREITEWTDPAVIELNPGLETVFLGGTPIRVARRVKGSSSTASITAFLHDACPSEWPSELVGKVITWPEDTDECDGSAIMTNCITSNVGTIGYIDSGHGHSEGLQEIELENADGNFISSKEAAEQGGIMSAADNAGIPEELDGSFANVNLLNQPGVSTWPIVALSYIYVRKDLTFIGNSASQTLLKAFLKALYNENYVSVCEEEFGFSRITGALRQKALDAIDALVVSAGAPEWTFEESTEARIGQGDHVISVKRQSYSDIEQDNTVDLVGQLEVQLSLLKAEYASLIEKVAELENGQPTEDDDHEHDEFHEFDDETQLTAALAMSSISFVFWMVAIIYILVKFVSGN